jgi:hypothetical protein
MIKCKKSKILPAMKSLHQIKTLVILLFIVIFSSCRQPKFTAINLQGEWELCLDSLNSISIDQLKFNLTAQLPGTLDEANIGKKNTLEPELKREVMLHLHRKYEYVGKAWYRNTIYVPESTKGWQAILKLGRVLWKSTVYIDGKLVGSENSLSVPHQYDLTGILTPGEHQILICIDNTRQFDLNKNDMAHAYTSQTQIKWNGILADFKVEFYPSSRLQGIQVFTDVPDRSLTVKLNGQFKSDEKLQFTVKNGDGRQLVRKNFQPGPEGIYKVDIPGEIQLWSEFSPSLYSLETSLISGGKEIQTHNISFGFRTLEARGNRMLINGKPVFLRGTLECAIFPKTGHPPVTVEEWNILFKSARSYGLNHLRFHSWCPPGAAFTSADQLGIYLQVELPNWNTTFGSDNASAEFIESEATRIIEAYGNHPSFCLMSMGNELQGDFKRLNNLVLKLKNQDNRHLYTTSSFTFEPGHGKFPEPADDFFITQYTDSGWVRGQGVFDSQYPDFKTDYTKAVQHLHVPLITHEIGQYSVFPNLKEIEKYTGVLDPLNFKAVKNDLRQKGLLHLAGDYLMASGQLARLLYKEEIERAFKTEGISGFQLLDLHDFPGQGTALVGLLDAFWDSKGIVDSTEFKTFCSAMVPLIWMDKAVYRNNETIKAEIGVANYLEDLIRQKINIELVGRNNQVLQQKELDVPVIQSGQTAKLGTFEFPLAAVKEASQLSVRVSIKGTNFQNSWQVWVYPDDNTDQVGNVFVTSSFDEAEKALNQGRKVFLNPEINQLNGLEGKFVQVFWSPVHFPNQPGTMGLLLDPKNHVFNSFPTEFHSNWQWWDLCKQSKTLEFADLPVIPLIRVVDNFFKNRNLTNLFEVRAGEGKLLFSSIDLSNRLNERPEASQLRSSVLKYMNSDMFNPENQINFCLLKNQFKKE